MSLAAPLYRVAPVRHSVKARHNDVVTPRVRWGISTQLSHGYAECGLESDHHFNRPKLPPPALNQARKCRLPIVDTKRHNQTAAERYGRAHTARSGSVSFERGLLRFWRGWRLVGLLTNWERCGFGVFVDLLLTWNWERKKPPGGRLITSCNHLKFWLRGQDLNL